MTKIIINPRFLNKTFKRGITKFGFHTTSCNSFTGEGSEKLK